MKVYMKPFPRIVPYIAAAAVVLIIAAYTYGTSKFVPDEISWFFHTDAYRTAYIARDFRRFSWQTYESYDHPDVSKFLYGAWLSSRHPGFWEERDRLEQEFGRWNFYYDSRLADIGSSPFAGYIADMRLMNVPFAAVSVFLVYMILLPYAGTIAAAAAAILFAVNPVSASVLFRATSDVHMMAFLLLSVWLLDRYLVTKKFLYGLASAVFAGLSVSAKLTGIIAPVTALMAASSVATDLKKTKPALLKFIAFFAVAGLIWVAVNPTNWFDPPGNTREFFSFRIRQMIVLQHSYPQRALLSFPDKYRAVWCSVLARCPDWNINAQLLPWLPVSLAVLSLGIVRVIRMLARPTDGGGLAVAWFIVLATVSTACYLPLRTDQYFFPLIISGSMLTGLGIAESWTIVRKSGIMRRS